MRAVEVENAFDCRKVEPTMTGRDVTRLFHLYETAWADFCGLGDLDQSFPARATSGGKRPAFEDSHKASVGYASTMLITPNVDPSTQSRCGELSTRCGNENLDQTDHIAIVRAVR
jgi:hypothetical protein